MAPPQRPLRKKMILLSSDENRDAVGFSIRFDHRVSNFATDDAPPPVEAKRSGSLPKILERLLNHEAFAPGTIH
jgi:hypothetical protein